MLIVVGVLLLWSLGFAFFWCLLAVNPPEAEPQVRSTLRLSNGYRGVTSAVWKLTSGDVDVRAVHLVVMLQRHETPDDLPADATEPAWNGYLLTVVCSRGAVFGRWVTPVAAELDLLQTASLN
jgi:hypothetical protein